MASRIVRSRSGRSRAPPVSSGRARSSRASSAAGGRTGTRAAASSIASGRPSSRAQIAATAAWFAAVRAKAGLAARARVTKSWTAAGDRQGMDGHDVLDRHPQHDPAGGEDLQLRAVGQQVGDLRRGLDHLFEVVQDEQRLAAGAGAPRAVRQAGGGPRRGDRGRGDRRQDEIRIAERSELDEADAVGESPARPGRRPEARGGSCRPRRGRSG